MRWIIGVSAHVVFGLTALMLLEAPVLAQSPPPPPHISEMATQLLKQPTSETFDRYAALLASDLKVTIDGAFVAEDKNEWLSRERGKLGKIVQQPVAYAVGGIDKRLGTSYQYQPILVIDRYDDRSDIDPNDRTLYHVNYKTRVIKYQIGEDNKIHYIDILEGGGYLQAVE